MSKRAPKKRLYTEEIIRAKAAEFDKKSEFREKAFNHYNAAMRMNILDEITAHMSKSNEVYTFEVCRDEALKYKTRSDFLKMANAHYQKCCRAGWLNDVCGHMADVPVRKVWTKEAAIDEAKKYSSITEFHKKAGGCYASCRSNGWMDEIYTVFNTQKRVPLGHWDDYDNCKSAALKYSSRTDFAKGNAAAYNACRNNGWMDEICAHMPAFNRKASKWTEERVEEEAKKYLSKRDFRTKSYSAYQAALRYGILKKLELA